MNLQDALFLVPLISNLAAFLAAALFARLHRTGPASGVITGLLALPGGAPGAVLALSLIHIWKFCSTLCCSPCSSPSRSS